MKTFRLKLISILILALAMATAANAMVKLSVNGDTSISEYTMCVGDKVWIGLYSDDYNPHCAWVDVLDGQGSYGSTDGQWTGNYIIYPEAGPDAFVTYFDLHYEWYAEAMSFDPFRPVQPGMHFEFEFECLAEGDVQIWTWDCDYTYISETVRIHQVAPDLGDAPDSTNNYGVPMTAYLSSVVEANYPTVYNDGNDLNPRGPVHKQPLAVAYLGEGVSSEVEADTGWDEDPNSNNIEPQYDIANQDGADDCIIVDEIWDLWHHPETFDFNVTVVSPNVPLYANVWFDWNHDGDWDDLLDFCGNAVPEWAVQNQQLLFSEPGLYTVTSDPFMPWSSLKLGGRQLWMRITLSEQPWTGSGSGGSGPIGGYQYGETEDHLIQVLFPSYCFPTDHPDFCNWLDVGSPPCWCYPRQCHGDTDNQMEGGTKTGYYYVHLHDLELLVSAWNVKEPSQGLGIAWPDPNICADFDHKAEGSTKVGYNRVHFNDLAILLSSWSILECVTPPCPLYPPIEPNCLDVP